MGSTYDAEEHLRDENRLGVQNWEPALKKDTSLLGMPTHTPLTDGRTKAPKAPGTQVNFLPLASLFNVPSQRSPFPLSELGKYIPNHHGHHPLAAVMRAERPKSRPHFSRH